MLYTIGDCSKMIETTIIILGFKYHPAGSRLELIIIQLDLRKLLAVKAVNIIFENFPPA